MFLPTTKAEIEALGWDQPDIILVTGDAYIDSPYIGIAIIGQVLANAGFRVGIIAQPDLNSAADISRLGEPRLFWGVTSGSVDSMVANYTALKKRRRQDDFTPGGLNEKRPDRAVIAYCNLIRRFFKATKPLVLGGIEASLRRVAHYDYWDDDIRRSLLFDAKADLLVYGMGERTILELAAKLASGESFEPIRGLCYIAKEPNPDYLLLPSYECVKQDQREFSTMFQQFYQENDPITARGLCQQHETRYLIQNPPAPYPNTKELDAIYDLDYQRDLHPYYQKLGPVRALETIRFSINTHLGCYGECNFCAIATHQGRTVRSRSEASILAEAEKLTGLSDFKGYILDLGGPTANMYGIECSKKLQHGSCQQQRCLSPQICSSLKPSHERQLALLKKIRQIPGIKKVFIASGIRHDLIMSDRRFGLPYLKELVSHHISGQLKLAPEHTVDRILKVMGKPSSNQLIEFKDLFQRLNQQAKKDQFLTYYLIAAHPGCTQEDMLTLKRFSSKELQLRPEQVQIFTPLPSTYAALMYYTERNPFNGEKLFVEKDLKRKEEQKMVLVGRSRPKK